MEIYYNQEDLTNDTAIWAVIEDTEWHILTFFIEKLKKFSIPLWKVKNLSVEDTLKKELLEELWIEITQYELIKVIDWTYPYNDIMRRIKTHIFKIISFNWEIINKESEKHTDMSYRDISYLKWLKEKTPELLTHATLEILD